MDIVTVPVGMQDLAARTEVHAYMRDRVIICIQVTTQLCVSIVMLHAVLQSSLAFNLKQQIKCRKEQLHYIDL